ncbi:MAG TPA: DUF1571 domain-containing protein [Gemmataceae bacterium]|nr:DUF1571 domain-containing protein [Gemmataceae bacterium]
MPRTPLRRATVFLFLILTGCGTVEPRGSTVAPVARRSKDPAKQVAMGPASTREPPLADPSTMIPPPPDMSDLIPPIPAAPGKEEFVSAVLSGKAADVVQVAGIVSPDGPLAVRPAVERARGVAEDPVRPAAESNLDALHRLHRIAADRFAQLEGFQCRLTRRETVSNKAMPEEVLDFKFRREPYSIYLKWVGLEAQGRELIYVQGKYDNKVQILTGRCEGLVIPAGMRVSRSPTDKDVRSKSRYDIREGGMGTAIAWLGKVLARMEADPTQANRVRYLGRRPVRERESGLEVIEETVPPDWEPLMPKGGKRTTHFDPDPASPSFGLPILITAVADTGRQVEYYWFDQLHPIRPSDADFDPDRLWRK